MASFNMNTFYAIFAALSFAIWILAINKILKKGDIKLITWLQMLIGGSLLCFILPFFKITFSTNFLFPYTILWILMAASRLFYNLGLVKIWPSLTGVLYSTKIFLILIVSYLVYCIAPNLLVFNGKEIFVIIVSASLIFVGILGLNKHVE
jgi:drug/metabolite transporter (DMT)-like permease